MYGRSFNILHYMKKCPNDDNNLKTKMVYQLGAQFSSAVSNDIVRYFNSKLLNKKTEIVHLIELYQIVRYALS